MNLRKGQRWSSVLFVGITVAFLLGTSVFVSAQATTGTIYGVVTDSTGAVIPQAAVMVENVQNGFKDTVKSGASGEYVFPTVMPGNYIVTARAQGFTPVTQTGVVVASSQNVHVIFNLSPGAIAQTVTVTANATLVDTREATLATTLEQKTIQEEPLETRNPYSLVSLAPGVQGLSNGSGAAAGFMGSNVGTTFSTNGMRVYENSYFLDGADFLNYFKPGGNIPPSPDALQEVRVLTSNSDAEFGTMPGAVVNMISRSGTNDFHGLAFDYLRNTLFDSRTEFVTGPATHLRQNVFGGNFGGPVLHDRLFGFFAYQGVRIATNTTLAAGAATVPTAAERSGDFSNDTVVPQCGAATYPCPGTPGNPNTKLGVIPAAYLDPVVQKMLQVIPVAINFKGIGGQSPQQIANSPVTDNQYVARSDYQMGSEHRLSYLYVHNYGVNPAPTAGGQTVLGYAGDVLADAETNDIVSDTWTISANKLNSARFYYTGSHYSSGDLYSNKNLPSQLGITAPCGGDPCAQPNVRMAGYIASFGNGGSAPTTIAGVNIGGGDTFNWIRGNHSIKLGGTLMESRFSYNTIGQREGIYTISSNPAFTTNPLANFLLGKSTTFNQSNGSVGTETFHRYEPSLFAQDDWKLNRRLTVDIGLRWETFPPVHGLNNMGSFAPNVQSKVLPTAPLGVLFNGDPGVPDGVLVTSHLKFAPRLGFAYDLTGNGRTSIRGGWGLFYSQVPETWFYQLSSPVFNESIAISNTTTFTNPYAGSTTPTSPFPYKPNLKNPTFSPGIQFASMPSGNKSVPYAMEENLTVEHQFSPNLAASVAYVGNQTRRFYAEIDQNAPVYSSTCTPSTCGTASSQLARRPYKPNGVSYVFQAIDELIPEASGSYDSLQASLTKRLAHDFSINASYVWEKAFSVAADPTNNGLTLITSSDNYHLRADRGKAATDVPQSFKASYVWRSPNIDRLGLVGREILSGWSLSGITTIQTGSPLNIVSGSDTNYDGTSTTDRPNQIADWHMPKGRTRAQKVAQYFNTAAFAPVPVGTANGLGNTQFDIIVGPGAMNTDLAAYKSFALYREHAVLFRAEAYNAFNHVNLGNPGVTMSSPASFGRITSASPGRVMQFALRYSF